MSYSEFELSTQDGTPIELYEFSQGLTLYRFTSSSKSHVEGINTFDTEAITRDDIGQTDEMSKGGIAISFPITNSFASMFLGTVPEVQTLVTIYRLHRTDAAEEKISYWKGRILSVKVDGCEIKFSCESIFSSLKRVGLRARYERSCRHTLYDPQCGISMDVLRQTGTVLVQSNTTLTVTGANDKPDGYFTGGMMKDVNEVYRFINGHSGTRISISKPYYRDIVSEEVVLYPGCDKTVNMCVSKYDNIVNYGGFPYIPSKNPFDGSIV